MKNNARTKGVLHDTEKDKVVATPSPIKEQSGGCCNHLSEMSGKLTAICPVCKKKFEISKETAERMKSPSYRTPFCSYECLYKFKDNRNDAQSGCNDGVAKKLYLVVTYNDEERAKLYELLWDDYDDNSPKNVTEITPDIVDTIITAVETFKKDYYYQMEVVPRCEEVLKVFRQLREVMNNE